MLYICSFSINEKCRYSKNTQFRYNNNLYITIEIKRLPPKDSFNKEAVVKYKIYTYNFFASDSASKIYVVVYLAFAYKHIADSLT